MRYRAAAVLAGLSGMAAAAGAAAGADVTFRTVALTDAPAPGLPAGVVFKYFSDPRVTPTGRIAFWAELGGPGVTGANAGSVWSDRSGLLAMVARTGDAAPGLVDTVYGALPRPAMSAEGRLAWPAVLVPASGASVPVQVGLYAEASGGAPPPPPTLLARDGAPAPGLGATVYADLVGLTFAGAGTAAWSGSAGAGAWAAAPGSPATPLALRGDPAPGAPAGHTLDYIDAPAVPHGPDGRPLLRATTVSGTQRSMGLWDVSGPAASPIAVAGGAAPSGGQYLDFDTGPVNCAGDCVAFFARLVPNPATPPGALFGGPAASPALIARAGDPAPGVPGATLAWVSAHPAVSAEGHIAFAASLGGVGTEDNGALFISGPGFANIRILAREGDQAPRLPAGTRFASFVAPVMDEAGRTVFLARLRGPGVTSATSWALYGADRAGRLRPLVRTGDAFDTGAAPPTPALRTVETITLDGDAAGAGHSQFASSGGAGAAAAGTLVFELAFKDGTPPQIVRSSGVFAARLGCFADVDGSGHVNVADFSAFLAAYAAADLRRTDFDGDGTLTVQDFPAYLAAYVEGCP